MTLEPDVAAKLQERCRRTGQSFKQVLNEVLRVGLNTTRAAEPRAPYRVRARALGLRPGVSLDSVGDLLEELDGPAYK